MGELISIIIPAFNVGPYLENCLESVLKQTYPDIEILLVDDGSTDETACIADRYMAEYPQKIRVFHTENRGVTLARFEGIKAAKGNWVGFVDGDDEIEPDMYERLYRNAKIFHADISHCGHRTIVNDGERIHDFYNTGVLVQQDRQSALKDLLDGPVEPSLCSKLFRRELLLELLHSDWMDTSVKFNEDLLMNYYLFRSAQCSVFEDFCGYHYLARSSSATRGGFRIEKVLDPLKVWKQILIHADSELGEIAWEKYLVACMRAYSYFAGQTDYKDEAKGYKKELLDHRDKWGLLSRNERIKLRALLFSPGMYSQAYRFYKDHFQKKVYE